MRRAVVVLLSAIVLLGTDLVGGGALVAAQDSTPAAEEEGFGEGVSFEFLGAGETKTLPRDPADIVLVRIGLEPGASLTSDPEDPGIALFAIEAGAVTFSVDAPITVLHLPEGGQPGPDDQHVFAAGEEFTMEEGDSALFPSHLTGEARNDGDKDASVLATLIVGPQAAGEREEAEVATPVT